MFFSTNCIVSDAKVLLQPVTLVPGMLLLFIVIHIHFPKYCTCCKHFLFDDSVDKRKSTNDRDKVEEVRIMANTLRF